MKKNRMIALIALGVTAILLTAAFIVVQNVLKPAEEEKAPPTLLPEELLGEGDPGERIEKNTYLLMFPRRDRRSRSITNTESTRSSAIQTRRFTSPSCPARRSSTSRWRQPSSRRDTFSSETG